MATEYGFIYILANECMPGIYKIGFTTNHPKTRLDQLSSSTSCPTPFELVAAFGVTDPREVEREIHAELIASRINMSREFFRMRAEHALDICRQYGDPCDDLFQTTYLESIVAKERREHDIAWKKEYFEAQCADPIFWPNKKILMKYDDIPF